MHTLVVGAGVFGAWVAKSLADAGDTVTLVDQYGPASGRASSADHTRVIRAGYGADAVYSRWASASLDDWRWLGEATGQPCYVETGALFLAAADDPYVAATAETLASLQLACEWLTPVEAAARYPQMSMDGVGAVLFEPRAGVLRARAAVQALVRWLASTRRIDYQLARIAPLDEDEATLTVRTSSGERLHADRYVFACGPWLPQLFPRQIGARVRATRQEVLHFGVPPGTAQFGVASLPVWIEFTAGLYGIPDLDARGFKIGVDRHGAPADPDTMPRLVEPAVVDEVAAWMARRFPGMRGMPLVDARVCQYESTSSGDFLIDRHPRWSDCWLVGGGSGHGFKHGPALGRHVAALLTGETEVQPRFALVGKQPVAARTVY